MLVVAMRRLKCLALMRPIGSHGIPRKGLDNPSNELRRTPTLHLLKGAPASVAHGMRGALQSRCRSSATRGVGDVSAWTRTYVLVRIELGRLGDAIRGHWRRILLGAVVGWIFAVVGGAFALASLEFHGLVSNATSDELGIVIVLYGVGIGALNAYALRPACA